MKQTELIYDVIYKVYRKSGKKPMKTQEIKDYQDKCRVYGDELPLANKDTNYIFQSALSVKHWHNHGQNCDDRFHTAKHRLKYRSYRRGENRCLQCGAFKGEPELQNYSHIDIVMDNICSENTLLKRLKEDGALQSPPINSNRLKGKLRLLGRG